ncbi:hypothetical protein BN1080_01508 [Planococcus massiliensis]|uniref:Helicase Helix-turn-helix domain-containing protein n=1 Tax=Planococcus massiliensis TaxID=1499687 RepID=A0A098EJW9_9BACL|nr:helix-turn-helix domain-containing protein [Planococcus massiliensis]CEG22578.1 hypothetical protein BN1080_01508 [Planococcus massiliensis]
MLFDELVITIMKSINLERTLSAPYHIIKGKKSGQTIQDIGYYHLHPYFALMPKLEKKVYDQTVRSLIDQKYIRFNEDVIDLTEQALAMPIPSSNLNGWKYRGNEMIFFNRLSLVVQTLSHTSQSVNKFDPIDNSDDIQAWVKRYLKAIQFRKLASVAKFKSEILDSLLAVALSDDHKTALMQRLSGFGRSGMTWEQIADVQGIQVLDAQLRVIEALHAWLEVIEEKRYPLLHAMTENIVELSSLTESTRRTEKLFKEGYSLAEISSIRHLKSSTIEDHFVELAMNDPLFDYSAFLSPELYGEIIKISQAEQTKRLRNIKDKVPAASYFQIRLALAIREDAQ